MRYIDLGDRLTDPRFVSAGSVGKYFRIEYYLHGKIRRGLPPEQGSRQKARPGDGPFVDEGHLYAIIDVIDKIAGETGKSVTQIALNWLLQRPTVSSLIVGARNEVQLIENIGAIGWSLSVDQVDRLDKVSRVMPIYPYWHQEGVFAERNPSPV
jgi:aryl-alcohol dehydrogenase-like predicted oxidoreductase